MLEQIPRDGIVPIGCDGAVIEYKRMRDCTRLLPEGEAGAGIWSWSCDNTGIQFNEVSDHKAPWDAQDFDADWNCRNTLMQYNYSHDNEGGFLLVCTNGAVREPVNAGDVDAVVRYDVSVNDGFAPGGCTQGFHPSSTPVGRCAARACTTTRSFLAAEPSFVDHTLLKMDSWGSAWP